MEFLNQPLHKDPALSVQVSVFNLPGGRAEYHMIFQFTEKAHKDPYTTRSDAIEVMHACIREWISQVPYKDAEAVFARYFLRNAPSQRPRIHIRNLFPSSCAISYIEQPPANGSDLAVWLYMRVPGPEPEKFTHYWTTEKFCLAGDVTEQTQKLLRDYQSWLQAKGCNMADHCLRTWFFIRDIDTNYTAFAKARNEYFSRIGMDENTHYIASTGIEGSNGAPSSVVTMDAYALKGPEASRITYLHGLSHLSPTNIYGVTFERGVSIRFDHHKQILISGTASIDKSGNVLHLDDIGAQTFRMWENVEVLLDEAGATFDDVSQIIVYLRRQEDHELVNDLFNSRFPSIPTVIVMGRVCRPAWLIEMECIALVKS